MNKKEQVFSTEWLGRTLTFKTGLLARHTDASVITQFGETTVLATVVESTEERDIDFFPLMVDFEERLYAGGIIKGSQWIKREGRPTDEAVLSGRMIDRSIRPLFDDSSRKEVQVVLTLLSTDGENDHDIVALIAASAALSISGVKWAGPLAGLRVGRIDDKLVFNPTFDERENSSLDLIIAGNKEMIIQIEAGAKEIDEEVMFEAFVEGKKAMAPVIDLIEEMKKAFPAEIIPEEENILITAEQIEEKQKKEKGIEIANEWLKTNVNEVLFDSKYYPDKKKARKAAVIEIKKRLKQYLVDQDVDPTMIKGIIGATVGKAVDAEVTRELIENKRRVDGRDIQEIRELFADTGIIPRLHGVGLFSRGETQIMSTVTLAGPGLAQSIEGLYGTGEKRYMHHYNFAPFSVGEARFMRGPGRREIGHGALAEKALIPVLPSKEEFPYTVRVVSETLGSNGSSSMGSTCGSTLALMHAGVPIKKPVAGVAIGLASYDDMSAWQVVTDIQDLEDGKGGMDFKVTGTKDGITAIQLDTKTLGLNDDILKEALRQAKEGRLKILDVMTEAIPEPNKELSAHAPRITTIKINPEKIRDVIGQGGKVINGIIDATGVTIDIDDDGTVVVCGNDAAQSAIAVKTIEDIVKEFEAGEIYTGKVVRMMDFGAFVEVLPGRDGLVHVSEMAPYRVNNPSNMVEIGDTVQVRIKEIDDQGRVNLSMKGLPENEARWQEKKAKASEAPQGFGGNGRNDRNGGGRFNNKSNGRPPRRDNNFKK